MVREGRILISTPSGDPDFGSNYYVTVYEVGAQVASASSGGTIDVRTGHGFAALDKLMLLSGSTFTTTLRTLSGKSNTQLFLAGGETLSVAQGDYLINLGQDSGSGTPNYDGAGLTVYSDMDFTTALTNNTVPADANGKFRYFFRNGLLRWELIRSTISAPFALYLDTEAQGVGTPATVTDNAVVRWDGAAGDAVQNSVVTISDSGATTGITTLGVSGTATMAAINASGTVAAAGAVTVGTTLTVNSTSTLTGAVACGAVTSTGNVTSGGHLKGRKATASITGGGNLDTTGCILIDITNTSGTNLISLTAPSSQDGQFLILRLVALTSGTLTIADSGTAALSAAWVPNADDTLTLMASGSIWYELARSSN